MRLRSPFIVVALSAALAFALVGDVMTVGLTEGSSIPKRPRFVAVKWPFPLDQWGLGHAYRCAAADCGVEVVVYLRAKIGFCNCDTGVSDDVELDRVGDLEVFSDRFVGLADGHKIKVGWMSGRSRPYRVDVRYARPFVAQAIAFNEQCDVIVATVIAASERLPEAERLALDFLNNETMLTWARAELGTG